ncbi:MAG: nucleoside hydrolase [Verrucomicrobia bacterium]|nr:nucleoside hydrolase [Verrucomicrobiota bacterium]
MDPLFTPDPSKKVRVILNTDAKNEADDQYAIVHAILTPLFDLHGIIPAHFGDRRGPGSLQASHEEVLKLLDLMNLAGRIPIHPGAPGALPDEKTAVPSEGSALIIGEALKDDPRPLHVAFLGPLTDMASALLEEPAIAERNVRVVWIGGEDWPVGGWEFNLSNDVNAANVVFRSKVEVWQIPSTIYKRMAVSYAELVERVYDKGELGKYLVEQLVDWNNRHHRGDPIEHRSLGDSPAVGVMMYPECGWFEWRAAPEFNAEMNYAHTGGNRPIRVYRAVDQRFIMEDFFAKLARWHRKA